ncbi:c-type cytochrome [Leptothrix discophora]|uniref:C-type cytochrome n=1 Tax=Leptothrix discophora TaxID=89 RepID=A0ABT9G3U9_LEPDI|nr:c-type cytochrome [Leptothrix discophora]MDP4301162.1 c-type cytochrome [Leptothrix discophora]
MRASLSTVLTVCGGAAAAGDGAALYAAHCAACHQVDGSGTLGLAPALKGPHWATLAARRDYLPTVLLKGMAGMIRVNGQTVVGSMPAFAAALDDAALAAIATHLATLQGDAARAPYEAAEFAPLRAVAGDPARTRQLRRSVLGD